MPLIGIGVFTLVKPDKAENEKDGFIVPDNAKKKAPKGEIIAVGSKVDPEVKPGRKAFYIPGSGHTLDIDGEEFLVLNDQQIIAAK